MPNFIHNIGTLPQTFVPGIADALWGVNNGIVHGTLALPVTFNTTDAAVLFTVPTGFRVMIRETFWEVTTPFTGGVSSTIGLSSSNANYNTKGDLLGGAAGDAAAVLVATGALAKGAAGAKMGPPRRVVLVAGDTIRFDRITSAFTAGVATAHVQYALLPSS
jgi:hypothetical protein